MFKVNYIVKDEIKKIYIFFGSHKIDDGVNHVDPNQLYKIEPNNPLFKDIFSEDEKANILEQKIEVELIEQYIHLDDTVETIKRKIQQVFSNKVLYEEIYLFFIQNTMLDPNKIYKQLTQNKKKKITQDTMVGFLLNFMDLENKSPEPKPTYTIDDLINLDIIGNKLLKKPLGHRLTSSMFKYYFTSNPYEMKSEDPYIQENVDRMISTSNSNLLMDFGKIYGNNIYVVLGDDIIDETSTPTFVNTYFPFLTKVGITDRSKYDILKADILKKQTTDLMQFRREDLFYNIHVDEQSKKIKYLTQGIRTIRFTKFQNDNLKMPLETLFKLIHATRDIPFIQYMAGQQREPVCRLFVDKYSKDGKKIPFLSKKQLVKIFNSISSMTAITYVIDTAENISLRCEINTKAEITITLELRDLLTINQVNLLIRKYVNPILQQVQNYLKQSGYNMTLFDSLYDTDIEISNINYMFHAEMEKKINFNAYIGCISSAFNMISSKLESNILMKFKKVSNFNKMSSYEELITKLINQSYTNNEIIKSLMDNFNYPEAKAIDIFTKFVEEKAIERDLHENRKLRVKDQPGFDVIMRHDKFTNNIIIDINGINNILYLQTLPIYIDSLLIINNESYSDLYKDDVETLCIKSNSKRKEDHIEDIIAEAEKPRQIPIFESSKMIGKQNDKLDDLFDAIYNDDEEDETAYISEDIVNPGMMYTDIESQTERKQSPIQEAEEEEADEEEAEEEDEEEAEEEQMKEDDEEQDLFIFGGADNEEEKNELIGILNTAKGKRKNLKLVAPPSGNLVKDIEGMPLTNPNYFFERMYERDPKLFLTKAIGNFKSYSRTCASNMYRQPVSLTAKEKKTIDEEHPGSYTKAIEYGSTPENKHYYICPRYWCLKSNTSITEQEVKDGVCGGVDAIIPSDAKKVPKGKYIVEFNAPAEHIDSKGEYIHHYPGYISSSKHPDNLCIPCCFKKWGDSKVKECEKDATGKSETKDAQKEETERDVYILGQDKFPIDPNRWGYLPITIQMFLNTENSECYSEKNSNILKYDHPCLLRRGVEYNEKYSFLCCIADLFSNEKPKVTVNILREKILKAATIDNFIMYHNGNLVELFQPNKIDYTKPIPVQYTSGNNKSAFYEKLNLTIPAQMNLFKKIVASYEMFIKYIQDESSLIDHNYIWDIICTPNTHLFAGGLNIVIMEIADDDITNNVNIYCPSNSYSTNFFDIEKNTLLLLKTNTIYEPIYLYKDGERKTSLKTFNFTNPDLLPNLKSLLLQIQTYMVNCQPLRSSPRVYTFKNNIMLHALEKELMKINGTIVGYVVNYNNKVVAVKAKIPDIEIEGVLPCYPSAQQNNAIPIVFIDNITIWSSYTDTIRFLTKVKQLNANILCQPVAKIDDSGLIVGVLTETNQFIMLSQPTENVDDDLDKIEDKNYITADIAIFNDIKETTKDKFIRSVKLETNFYNSFRNLLRTVLNKLENRKIKNDVRTYIENSKDKYSAKLEKVITMIKPIMLEYVAFSTYTEESLNSITQVTSCLDDLSCEESFCLKSGTTNCKLLIPNINLMNNLNNETIYYARMSDELIRFNRIKSFMFDPDIYLSFSKINYDLQDDEIILLQSAITGKGYLDNLEFEQPNKYITNNTFDIIQPDPAVSQKYSDIIARSVFSSEEVERVENMYSYAVEEPIIEPKMSIDFHICNSKKLKVDSKYAKVFSSEYEYIQYDRNVNCGMQLLIDIMKTKGMNHTKKELIDELLKLYTDTYLKKYPQRVFEILKMQGKKEQIDKILNNIITFEDYILSEEYFISELDIIIITLHHDINVIILDSMKKRADDINIDIIPNKYNPDGDYILIANYLYIDVPQFKIIYRTDSVNTINYNNLKESFNKDAHINLTICNNSELAIEDFDLDSHYFTVGPTQKKKKKLVLKPSN